VRLGAVERAVIERVASGEPNKVIAIDFDRRCRARRKVFKSGSPAVARPGAETRTRPAPVSPERSAVESADVSRIQRVLAALDRETEAA
jgi:hypothetical protein